MKLIYGGNTWITFINFLLLVKMSDFDEITCNLDHLGLSITIFKHGFQENFYSINVGKFKSMEEAESLAYDLIQCNSFTLGKHRFIPETVRPVKIGNTYSVELLTEDLHFG